MRATICAVVLSVLMSPALLAQATLAGTWEGQLPRGTDKPETIVMTFTVNGNKLDGSILSANAEFSIQQGIIKGRTIEFTTERRINGEPSIYYWTGTVTGDSIAFSRIDQYRQGPFSKVTVKRKKDAPAATP